MMTSGNTTRDTCELCGNPARFRTRRTPWQTIVAGAWCVSCWRIFVKKLEVGQ